MGFWPFDINLLTLLAFSSMRQQQKIFRDNFVQTNHATSVKRMAKTEKHFQDKNVVQIDRNVQFTACIRRTSIRVRIHIWHPSCYNQTNLKIDTKENVYLGFLFVWKIVERTSHTDTLPIIHLFSPYIVSVVCDSFVGFCVFACLIDVHLPYIHAREIMTIWSVCCCLFILLI